jgi:4-amino-4-deoxy-L-arabinose transferase-like glycosyltransferase
MGRAALWAAWALPFAVYLFSLSSAVGYWDTGEAQTVPWIFGIMHPTGFPAFTILAGAFAHIVAIGTVAWRVALFSAISMTVTAWLVARIVCELDGDPWIAAACAWLFAFGSVAWTRGTRAEVHALAVCFAVATLFFALRWYRTGVPANLMAGALTWGLGIASHPIVALLLPALLIVFIAHIRKVTLRTFALAFAALLFGVAWYAYLPARSAAITASRLDPTRALGIPPGRAFWDNDHPSTWNGFVKEVSGNEFSAGGTFARIVSPSTYAGRIPGYFWTLLLELSPLGVLLALGGWFALWQRDDALSIALLAALAFPTAFGLAYTIEADSQRYYLIGFAVGAALAGYGASAVIRELPPLRRMVLAIVVLLSLGLIAVNRQTFEQRSDPGAQAVIASVIKKTPRDAVLISPWLYATPLAYAAYVEHSLGRRVVDTAWLADDAKRVPRWTRTRPVYVVGILFGEVPGYRTVRIAGSPDLYRVVPLQR